MTNPTLLQEQVLDGDHLVQPIKISVGRIQSISTGYLVYVNSDTGWVYIHKSLVNRQLDDYNIQVGQFSHSYLTLVKG